jgi:hypothetical protein
MAGGYIGDCVAHACTLAELLLSEGRSPWIGELRGRVVQAGERVIHEPLVAAKRAWNAHFVCCCDGEVYDPIAGEPVPLAEYASRVFGWEVPLTERFSVEETASLLRKGELRHAFRRR